MEQEPRAVAETDDAQRYAHMGPGLWLLRVLHGALIGAGAILPGISGGVLCVMFGIYRPMMALLAHPFRSFRIYYRLFIPVILGWAVGFFALAGAVNLLMEAYPDYAGSITFDEKELREIGSRHLYKTVSVVQQNVFIFNATIRDNITMFSSFPQEAVDSAIRLSGLSALMEAKGEDYLCGENGCNLSGGEKQRISIARSLLKKSQVLLVDEATAALDAQTAFQISSAILDMEQTAIVITHALEEKLLRRYDRILTLKNGSITESGTFQELMDKKGYFYSLFTVSQ